MVPAVFASSDIWGKGPLLFHRHALSKVPGLINIAALPQKLRFWREPYDLTQIVRNESVRFQDFALCAKCLCAALAGEPARLYPVRKRVYSTVTLLARFRGLSMSQPRWRAT